MASPFYTPFPLALPQPFFLTTCALPRGTHRYADAIVKNFANSAVMAILVVVSAYAFGMAATLTSYLGVAGVLVTTYAYMNIALKMG